MSRGPPGQGSTTSSSRLGARVAKIPMIAVSTRSEGGDRVASRGDDNTRPPANNTTKITWQHEGVE